MPDHKSSSNLLQILSSAFSWIFHYHTINWGIHFHYFITFTTLLNSLFSQKKKKSTIVEWKWLRFVLLWQWCWWWSLFVINLGLARRWHAAPRSWAHVWVRSRVGPHHHRIVVLGLRANSLAFVDSWRILIWSNMLTLQMLGKLLDNVV